MQSDNLKKLRIFVASPRDVANERARLVTIIEDLKALAEYVGVTLELTHWHQVPPDLGRAEQIILDQIKPDTWDVFIGILWHRFGTPTGGKDPHTGKEYLSGTEEEFRVAYRLWQHHKRPRVMFYWCKRSVPFDDLDPVQFQRVKDFFAAFAPEADHPGFFQTFENTELFERFARQNLSLFLLDYSEQVNRRVVTSQEVQTFVPTVHDNLPRRVAFFGRDKEMEAVLGALDPDERGWGVVIDGIGGIGKTALAVEAAYLCKEKGLFDAFIFVSAKQKRLEPSGIKAETRAVTTLDEFVTESANALGKPDISQLTGEDKRRGLLDTLRTTRVLLIYDNLETLTKAEQEALADWLRFLPQGCKAILTSRRRGGEGALWLRLGKLDWDAARAIIEYESGRETYLAETMRRAGMERWRELYDVTGGSPLALRHTLGLMRIRKTLTIDGALEMLRGNRDADLQRFVFQEACKKLGENELRALRALSFFDPSATFEAWMQVAELSRSALETIDRLSALSLVDVQAGEERYALHPLTSNFVRDKLLHESPIAYEMGRRFAKYWVDFAERFGGSGRNYKTFNRLEAEWTNLNAAAKWLYQTAAVQGNTVGDKDAARRLNDLARALRQFLWFGGRWDERVELSAKAYEVICALSDWSSAGWRAYDVAWIYLNRAKTNEAIQWADRCEEAWTRGGSKSEQAVGKRMHGLLTEQRTDYETAERLYQDALTIWRDLENDEWIALVLDNLGELERKRKHYDLADRYYRETLTLAEKIDNKELKAIFAGNLGELALDREQWPEARKWFEKGLPLAKEVGRQNLIAQAQFGLAHVEEAEGHADLALPLAQEVLKIYERLQHQNLAKARELVERLASALTKKQI